MFSFNGWGFQNKQSGVCMIEIRISSCNIKLKIMKINLLGVENCGSTEIRTYNSRARNRQKWM